MKLVFIFLMLVRLTTPFSSITKFYRQENFETNYQLRDKQITKAMATPIELTQQAPNLLINQAYETEAQLELPSEDLEYIRSNAVTINLCFTFQMEWWNSNEYQIMKHPQIVQSLKSAEVLKKPSQLIMRLKWPSNYVSEDRPFAHTITFSYDSKFNLSLKQQLTSDLSASEIEAIAHESQGAPQNYRIQLSNIYLSYPVPAIFYNLQTKFINVQHFFSRHQQMQWWEEFNQLLLKSDFLTIDHFDDYFQRPALEDAIPQWLIFANNPQYLLLRLEFKELNHLKIYQAFFPHPQIKVCYRSYLDLTLEFDQSTLILLPHQDYWTAFKQQNIEWTWWLNFVQATIQEEYLILESKNSPLVQGKAKIQVVESKIKLAELGLVTQFEYLQLATDDNWAKEIFELFKNKNENSFADEQFNQYQIIKTNTAREFLVTARDDASFQGSVSLGFKTINNIEQQASLVQEKQRKLFHWSAWNWMLLAVMILCCLVLASLKFWKSKPTKK